jgi:hypothetical protein
LVVVVWWWGRPCLGEVRPETSMLKIDHLRSRGRLSGPTMTCTSTETIGDTTGRRDACWIHLFWSSTTTGRSFLWPRWLYPSASTPKTSSRRGALWGCPYPTRSPPGLDGRQAS